MTPFFFGPERRQVFGLFEPGNAAAGAESAVLLCNPFGQETVRTHRMFRVLADRLARAGIDVMRFDYHATGDSPGDDDEGEPAGWVDDLVVAHAELQARSRARRIVWIGVRLGATLAIKASARVPRAPDRLILWEPIVDGKGYLQELGARHVQTLKSSFNAPARLWQRRLDPALQSLDREGVGFELGDEFRRQIAGLAPEALPQPRAARLHLIERDTATPAAALVPAWRSAGLQVDQVVLEHDFDWLAAEALNTALVPTEAIQTLNQLVVGST